MALAAERYFKELVPAAPGLLRQVLGGVLTFHFVCFCWMFFRAQDLATVQLMLEQIAFAFQPQLLGAFLDGYAPVLFWMLIGYALHFLPSEVDEAAQRMVTNLPLFGKAVLITAVVMLVMQVKSADVQPFIYFQF